MQLEDTGEAILALLILLVLLVLESGMSAACGWREVILAVPEEIEFRPDVHACFPEEESVDEADLVFVANADVWITSVDVEDDEVGSTGHLIVSNMLGAEVLLIELVSFLWCHVGDFSVFLSPILFKKFPLFLLPFRLTFPKPFINALSLELLLVRDDDCELVVACEAAAGLS